MLTLKKKINKQTVFELKSIRVDPDKTVLEGLIVIEFMDFSLPDKVFQQLQETKKALGYKTIRITNNRIFCFMGKYIAPVQLCNYEE